MNCLYKNSSALLIHAAYARAFSLELARILLARHSAFLSSGILLLSSDSGEKEIYSGSYKAGVETRGPQRKQIDKAGPQPPGKIDKSAHGYAFKRPPATIKGLSVLSCWYLERIYICAGNSRGEKKILDMLLPKRSEIASCGHWRRHFVILSCSGFRQEQNPARQVQKSR